MVEASGISKGLGRGKWPKPTICQRFPCGEERTWPVKGNWLRVELWIAAEGRKRQSKKNGKWQEGCLDGNAAATAFSGAGLCLGTLPHAGSAPYGGPRAQQLDTQAWESTVMLTSLSSVALSGNDPQRGCFRLLIFSLFLGSASLISYTPCVSGQNVFDFGHSIEDRKGIVTEDDF